MTDHSSTSTGPTLTSTSTSTSTSATEATPAETLSSLLTSLSAVEDSFEPLLSQPWTETLEQLGNGTVGRTKMDVMASYAINDLIWIYLKLRGIDPASHDVTGELDRIQTYYTKIRAVEAPEAQRPILNTAAAKRFITSSLPRSQHLPPTSAAALAQSQAQRALAQEADEREQGRLSRLGKANRFRFIAKEGEKVIPGNNAADDEGDGNDDNEYDDEEAEDEDDDGDTLMAPNDTEAEDLLRDLDQEIALQEEQP